MQRVI
jgi:hypothetical protein